MARTRLIALLLAAGLAGACAGHGPAVPSVPMETALERATAASRTSLGESLRAGLEGPGTFGIEPPGAPVLVPPDVRRVWVPTHENAEGELIAGHWVFLRVRDFRWFLDSPPARDATPEGLPPDRREPPEQSCHGQQADRRRAVGGDPVRGHGGRAAFPPSGRNGTAGRRPGTGSAGADGAGTLRPDMRAWTHEAIAALHGSGWSQRPARKRWLWRCAARGEWTNGHGADAIVRLQALATRLGFPTLGDAAVLT